MDEYCKKCTFYINTFDSCMKHLSPDECEKHNNIKNPVKLKKNRRGKFILPGIK